MNFPNAFAEVDVMLTWAAEASKLISGFLTKSIGPCIIVESVFL